jgi:hypothetical protein
MLSTDGGAERIDRLRVVADHGQARPSGASRPQDLGLQAVGVLVLVDEHVVEVPATRASRARLLHHRVPEQQQVVVVEHASCCLRST